MKKYLLALALVFAFGAAHASEGREGFCAGEAHFKACVNANRGAKEYYYPPEAHKACSELEEYVNRRERQELERCLVRETRKLTETQADISLGYVRVSAFDCAPHHSCGVKSNDDGYIPVYNKPKGREIHRIRIEEAVVPSGKVKEGWLHVSFKWNCGSIKINDAGGLLCSYDGSHDRTIPPNDGSDMR
jgi:hypothetical protein